MKKFELYWLDGKRETVEGDTIADAFTKSGYGAGAMGALDYYKELAPEPGERLKREVKTTVEDVLDLITAGDSYGYRHQILDDFLARLLVTLSTEECEQSARDLEAEEGCGTEDYDEALQSLIEFRERHFNSDGTHRDPEVK